MSHCTPYNLADTVRGRKVTLCKKKESFSDLSTEEETERSARGGAV